MIVADNETDIDYLYYEPVARTVVRLIKEKAGEAITIGLHGDWGAGKSSSLMMIQKAFDADDGTLCVRFNGWLFEGYDDAKAVLIEEIVAKLLEKRSTIAGLKDQAAKVLGSVNWLKIARTLGGVAMTTFTGLPNGGLLKGLGKAAGEVLANPQDLLTGEMFTRMLDGAGDHYKAAEPEDTAPQRIHQFRRDFEQLLRDAKIDRLVVLVDDLDRCLPETAIATMEAIRLFLFVPNAAFVIAADEGMIEYAVRRHFPELSSVGPNSYARNYLEKLIQVPFRMPALGLFETRIYLTLLLYLNSGVLPDSDEFRGLLEVAREALRTPWTGEGFTRGNIAGKIVVSPALDEALQVAGDITPILAEGASGNPRQIKRFVNGMKLRLEIADDRGFGKDLSRAILAKLMLAERFAPNLFEAIARDCAANKTSRTITDLERDLKEMDMSEKPLVKGKRADAEANAEDAWARRWAGIAPSLGDVDLRPYVFISRDRRVQLGGSVAADPLTSLVERLSSTALVIHTTDPNLLQALKPGDADKVFEELARKLTSADDLGERPPAADGVALLVQHRPELQDSLLVLLGRLSPESLGVWILTGWNQAFDSQHQLKFKQQVKVWAEQDKNPKLASVAKLQLSSGKSKRGNR